jgi:hypothetical protein
MTADLAQEELERVRGRLDARVEVPGDGGRLLDLLRRLDELDVPLLELPVDRLDLRRVELERVHDLVQLDGVDEPCALCPFEQRVDLGGVEGRLVRHESALR